MGRKVEKSKSDNATALVKAAVSLVPIAGGAVASLIGDYVPTATQRRVDESLQLLSDRLAAIEGRIDPALVNADEFSELFKSSYLTIIRTHCDEKTDAAISIIVNILLGDGDSEKLTFNELDHFSRVVDTLSLGAFQVLAVAYRVAKSEKIADIETQSHGIVFGSLSQQMPEYEPSFLMGLVGELSSANLLHLPGAPSIRTAGYANYPVELTPIGVRFVERIMHSGR